MYWAVAVDVYTFVIILSLGLAVTLPSIGAIGVKQLAINAEQINEHVARELTMRRRETVLPNRWPG